MWRDDGEARVLIDSERPDDGPARTAFEADYEAWMWHQKHDWMLVWVVLVILFILLNVIVLANRESLQACGHCGVPDVYGTLMEWTR